MTKRVENRPVKYIKISAVCEKGAILEKKTDSCCRQGERIR